MCGGCWKSTLLVAKRVFPKSLVFFGSPKKALGIVGSINSKEI